MLTEQERKWLEERNNLCKRCTRHSPAVVYCSCGHNFNTNAYSLTPDYRDAAEFEARVQRALMYQYEKAYHCKDVSGGFMPDRDTMLMYARLAVEQEMDQ